MKGLIEYGKIWGGREKEAVKKRPQTEVGFEWWGGLARRGEKGRRPGDNDLDQGS